MSLLLEIDGLDKRFGGLATWSRSISFGIEAGERLALIGPNGAGQDDADQSHERRSASRCRPHSAGRAGHHPTHADSAGQGPVLFERSN